MSESSVNKWREFNDKYNPGQKAKCKLCGERINEYDKKQHHKSCVIDFLYENMTDYLVNGNKISTRCYGLAKNYKISMIQLRNEVKEDLNIKKKKEKVKMGTELRMEVSEMRFRYKEAKNKKEQVYILAEMNLCEPWEIVKTLVESGIDPRGFAKSLHKEYHIARENGMKVPKVFSKSEKTDENIEKSVEKDAKPIEKSLEKVENDKKETENHSEAIQKTIDIQRAEIDKLNERIKELEKQVEHYKVKGFNEGVDSMVAENKVKQLEEKNAEYIELIQERNSEIDDLESEVQGYADENRVLHKKLKAAEKYILNLLIYEQAE